MPSANDRQIITVPILITDDDVFENSETFSVVLNASDSGVMLGPNREATVTILDNEGKMIIIQDNTSRWYRHTYKGKIQIV